VFGFSEIGYFLCQLFESRLPLNIIGCNGSLDFLPFLFGNNLRCLLSFGTLGKGLKYLVMKHLHLLVNAPCKHLGLLLPRHNVGDLSIHYILHLGERFLTLLPNGNESCIHLAGKVLSALLK
jgi:hypothetical protein